MHLSHVPAGKRVRYEIDAQHSLYGYVDVINGIKFFITPTVSYYVDVTNLFLKRADGQEEFIFLCAHNFYHLDPLLPFARQ